MQAGLQVKPNHYRNRSYLNLIRVLTHWYQASTVAECCPNGGRILEIGPGSGHTTWLLGKWGYETVTLDIDPELGPDALGDVRNLPFDRGTFDCVLAAEVLEHIPFADFGRALSELARVTRRYVIITLPAPLVGISLLLNLPKIRPLGLSVGFPYWKRHDFGGEHYWELGKKGYAKWRVRRHIRKTGLRIRREFRPAPSLYCYFFVMELEQAT